MRVRTKQIDVHKLSPHPDFVLGKGAANPNLRHPGHHVSGVLRYLAIKNKIVKWGQGDEKEFRVNEYMFLGQAFEAHMVKLIPSKSGTIWQPGEGKLVTPSRKPVWMNPDGFTTEAKLFGRYVQCIEEFKLTWKSTRTPVQQQWMYLKQVLSYCKLYDVSHCRLWVFHVNGGYENRMVGSPVLLRHDLEFTVPEIKNTWRLIHQTVDADKNNELAEGF